MVATVLAQTFANVPATISAPTAPAFRAHRHVKTAVCANLEISAIVITCDGVDIAVICLCVTQQEALFV